MKYDTDITLTIEEELDLAEELLESTRIIAKKSESITSESFGINSCARMLRIILTDFLKKNGRDT